MNSLAGNIPSMNLQKSSRTCRSPFKIRNLILTNALVNFNNAQFLSFLQYDIIVWAQTHMSYIEPIFKMQKRAVRAISQQSYLAHSLPTFEELKLLMLSDVFKLKLIKFVFKSTNKMTAACFHNTLSSNSSMLHYKMRQSVHGDLYLVKINTVQYV